MFNVGNCFFIFIHIALVSGSGHLALGLFQKYSFSSKHLSTNFPRHAPTVMSVEHSHNSQSRDASVHLGVYLYIAMSTGPQHRASVQCILHIPPPPCLHIWSVSPLWIPVSAVTRTNCPAAAAHQNHFATTTQKANQCNANYDPFKGGPWNMGMGRWPFDDLFKGQLFWSATIHRRSWQKIFSLAEQNWKAFYSS